MCSRGRVLSLFPCIAAYLQMIRPGIETRAHRHSSSAVYFVREGSGTTEINGTSYHWSKGDVLVVAPSAVHKHSNAEPRTGGAVCGAGQSDAEGAGVLSRRSLNLEPRGLIVRPGPKPSGNGLVDDAVSQRADSGHFHFNYISGD